MVLIGVEEVEVGRGVGGDGYFTLSRFLKMVSIILLGHILWSSLRCLLEAASM